MKELKNKTIQVHVPSTLFEKVEGAATAVGISSISQMARILLTEALKAREEKQAN